MSNTTKQKLIIYHWDHTFYDNNTQCVSVMKKTIAWKDVDNWLLFNTHLGIFKTNIPSNDLIQFLIAEYAYLGMGDECSLTINEFINKHGDAWADVLVNHWTNLGTGASKGNI